MRGVTRASAANAMPKEAHEWRAQSFSRVPQRRTVPAQEGHLETHPRRPGGKPEAAEHAGHPKRDRVRQIEARAHGRGEQQDFSGRHRPAGSAPRAENWHLCKCTGSSIYRNSYSTIQITELRMDSSLYHIPYTGVINIQRYHIRYNVQSYPSYLTYSPWSITVLHADRRCLIQSTAVQ